MKYKRKENNLTQIKNHSLTVYMPRVTQESSLLLTNMLKNINTCNFPNQLSSVRCVKAS
jgi:hypothetical protein